MKKFLVLLAAIVLMTSSCGISDKLTKEISKEIEKQAGDILDEIDADDDKDDDEDEDEKEDKKGKKGKKDKKDKDDEEEKDKDDEEEDDDKDGKDEGRGTGEGFSKKGDSEGRDGEKEFLDDSYMEPDLIGDWLVYQAFDGDDTVGLELFPSLSFYEEGNVTLYYGKGPENYEYELIPGGVAIDFPDGVREYFFTEDGLLYTSEDGFDVYLEHVDSDSQGEPLVLDFATEVLNMDGVVVTFDFVVYDATNQMVEFYFTYDNQGSEDYMFEMITPTINFTGINEMIGSDLEAGKSGDFSVGYFIPSFKNVDVYEIYEVGFLPGLLEYDMSEEYFGEGFSFYDEEKIEGSMEDNSPGEYIYQDDNIYIYTFFEYTYDDYYGRLEKNILFQNYTENTYDVYIKNIRIDDNVLDTDFYYVAGPNIDIDASIMLEDSYLEDNGIDRYGVTTLTFDLIVDDYDTKDNYLELKDMTIEY